MYPYVFGPVSSCLRASWAAVGALGLGVMRGWSGAANARPMKQNTNALDSIVDEYMMPSSFSSYVLSSLVKKMLFSPLSPGQVGHIYVICHRGGIFPLPLFRAAGASHKVLRNIGIMRCRISSKRKLGAKRELNIEKPPTHRKGACFRLASLSFCSSLDLVSAPTVRIWLHRSRDGQASKSLDATALHFVLNCAWWNPDITE